MHNLTLREEPSATLDAPGGGRGDRRFSWPRGQSAFKRTFFGSSGVLSHKDVVPSCNVLRSVLRSVRVSLVL